MGLRYYCFFKAPQGILTHAYKVENGYYKLTLYLAISHFFSILIFLSW